jgi:hypothetical protein
MSTRTKDNPTIRPLLRPASATVTGITIRSFSAPEAPEVSNTERTPEGRETEYSFVSYAEPLALLRERLEKIDGIKRVCLSFEDFVIHVWIIIEKEDWSIREQIYNAEYDVYLSETLAFHFDFHVSEQRELSDCVPLFGS